MPRLVKIGLIALIIIGIAIAWVKWPPREVEVPSKEIVPVEEQKAENWQDHWMSKLSSMENCPTEGIMDVGSLSYGHFCWKQGTWKGYVKLTEVFPHTEQGEAMNLVGDLRDEKKMVQWILDNESPTTIKRLWYTSIVTRKLGLPRELAKGR